MNLSSLIVLFLFIAIMYFLFKGFICFVAHIFFKERDRFRKL